VDDLAHAVPVEPVETLTDLGGKIFQPADDQRQFAFGIGGLDCHLLLLLQLRHAPLQPGNARLELGLVDEARGVAVDDTFDAAPKRADLMLEPHDLLRQAGAVGRLTETPPVLIRHAARIFQ
jgi:hypothetical protein